MGMTPETPEGKKNLKQIIIIAAISLVGVLLLNALFSQMTNSGITTVSYGEFLQKLESKEVLRVSIEGDRIYFSTPRERAEESAVQTPAPQASPSPLQRYIIELRKQMGADEQMFLTGRMEDPDLVARLEKAGVQEYGTPIAQEQSPIMSFLLSWILPMVIIFAPMLLIMRFTSKRMNSGAMSFGKNTAKIYGEKETGVTFKDVAGQEEAKESLEEIIDFLKNPDRYSKIGARLPKGALLVGPPGTGKTLLAKAVAGEAAVPFFALSGSDFVEMFVGVGASRVRDLFKQAMDKAPCIVFIDEIDAIGKSRAGNAAGGNDEREQTLNQLLAEMDGFDSSKGVVILAATNRPEVLDPALLRPGRFDRRIIVDKPDFNGRLAILKVHVRDVKMDADVDLAQVARLTPGAVGADLANMINEAALHAVRNKRNTVNQEDLMESIETVVAGKEKKDRILSAEEKQLVAVHESGHALVALLHNGRMPVQKITIVPRTMGSLGYVLQAEEDEKFLHTKEDLLARLSTLLAGRAAEELVAGKTTTGASNDIEKATDIARAMVTQYGMSDAFGMVKLEDQNNPYLGGRFELTCSPETAAKIDEEVRKIIGHAYDGAREALENNRDKLMRVTNVLVEKETLTGEEFMEIIRSADANIDPPPEDVV